MDEYGTIRRSDGSTRTSSIWMPSRSAAFGVNVTFLIFPSGVASTRAGVLWLAGAAWAETHDTARYAADAATARTLQRAIRRSSVFTNETNWRSWHGLHLEIEPVGRPAGAKVRVKRWQHEQRSERRGDDAAHRHDRERVSNFEPGDISQDCERKHEHKRRYR